MPFIEAVSTIDFPHRIAQEEIRQFAQKLFVPAMPQVERMLTAFDNTEIRTRNLCKPLSYFAEEHSFEEQNTEYIRIALEYAERAIENSLARTSFSAEMITDLIVISTTGLATPSLDALIINKMRLNRHINRTPVFGLGCAGGVAGITKANLIARANPDAIVLVVSVELCSLTFLRHDYSKSNFIGSTLFSDGVAACIITGDNQGRKQVLPVKIIAGRSTLYYDTLDVMGWTFLNEGFKVVFSQEIPTLIAKHVLNDVTTFLEQHHLSLADVKNFIFHPGGKKVLNAYREALPVAGDFLKNTREVMNDYGNMSSPTVLYVLERFISSGFEKGHGLMMSMGPGFSSEMALVEVMES